LEVQLMSCAAARCLLPAAVFSLTFLLAPQVTLAQVGAQAGGAPVPPIKTADGVELRGHFYQCPKKNAPTVLVLHAFGEKSDAAGWKTLAQTLQPNCSVMLFDFRGHGESKTVDPQEFWKYPINKGAGAKSYGKDTIEYKNFDKMGYLPVLANDIAAVKGYLDRQNDTGNCNTSSLILIGDREGAALGSLWLNSEWHRYKTQVGFQGVQLQKDPEGKDTIAAVWISAVPKLGLRKVSLSGMLELPGKIKTTPMLMIYGDEDLDGKTAAKSIDKAITGGAKKPAAGLKYTGAYSAGKTKLKGVSLLEQKSLKTDAAIAKWLESVVNDKQNEWSDHDYKKSQYIWQVPASQPMIVKPTGENTPLFDTYEKFLR
jgi:predicted esterase